MNPDQLTRRELLLLGAAAPTLALSQTTPLRVRRNVNDPLAATDIATYRQGVTLMKANTDAFSPLSWAYWENVHGMLTAPPPDMVQYWNRCQHNNSQFLPWHRAALIFFERTIGEVTGVTNFALPYWCVFYHPAIPPAFAHEMVDGGPNPLYHASRRYWQPSPPLQDFLAEPEFFGMQRALEANPHGLMHRMVNGVMGNIKTSAQDPLFWAVHSAADRLWWKWRMQAGRTDPVDPNWRSVRHWFTTDRSLTTSQVLSVQTNGYIYDHSRLPPPVVTAPAASTTTMTASTTTTSTGRRRPVARKVPISRGLTLHMPGDDISTIVLHDIEPTAFGADNGFHFEIYVNLASGALHREHHVGTLNSFVLQANSTRAMVLEVGEKRRALAAKGLWPTGELRLSFVSNERAAEPLVRIGSVQGM